MTLLRIDTRHDEATGRYYLAIYWPADAMAPFVTTMPRYMTEEAAQADLIAIIADAAGAPRGSAAGVEEALPR